MSRRGFRFLIGGIVLVVVFLGVLLLLPLFLNPIYLKDMAIAHIQQTLGSHIQVGGTSLSLLPYPHVEVSEVIVKERPDAHAFFRAKFISLDLQLFPLLRQKFSVKELLIDQPEIEIKRDREGEWSMFRGDKQKTENSLLTSLLFMEKVVILNGRMTLIDESPVEEARGVVLEEVNLSITSLESPMRTADVEASGKIRQGQGVSEFIWNGSVDFGASKIIQTKVNVPDILQSLKIEGQVRVQDLDIHQVAEFFSFDSFAAIDMGLANIESSVIFMPDQMGYEMILSELLLESTHGSFSGNANVTGLLVNDLTIFVSMTSTPIALQTVKRVVPKSLLPIRLASLWDEAEVDGTIQVMQATVAGSTRSDVGISVVGSFQLDQSVLKYGPNASNIEIMHGMLVVEPDRVRFADFSGRYDDIPIRSANGLILFNESGPWLDLELQGEVLAAQVIQLLTRISDFTPAQSYLSRLHVSEGRGDLRLHFAGLLEGENGVSLTAGEYDAQEITLHVQDLKDQIIIKHGKIEFTPYDLKFHEINGAIGESQFRVNGLIKTGQRALIDTINIQANLQDTFLSRIMQKSSRLSFGSLDGVVTLQAVISGSLDAPKITGEFDLLDSALHISGLIQKPRGVAGSLNFSIRHKANGDVALDQVELAILPLKLSARGLVRLRPTFEILARVNTGPIYLGLLPDGVVVGEHILQSGILEVSMDVSGRGLEMKNWRPRGWIALTEGVAKVKGLKTPISNLFLRLKMTPSIAEIKRLEFKMEKSDIHLTGTVKHWRDKPDIDVSLESSNLDLDLLLPHGERSSIQTMLEGLAGTSTLIGNIHIRHSTYKTLTAENLSSIIRIREGLVTLDRIRGEAYGESIAGRVFIHLPLHKPAAIRSSFHLRGIPFEHLHQAFGSTPRLVTGQFSVRGMIQGHGRDSRGVMATLSGNMDVVIKEGHVEKGTVLPRILTILNLPTILRGRVDLRKQGFPFRKVTATVNIQDGVMTSHNVIIDSPIMKMTTAGHYDLAKDKLDLVAAVSPFGQYSEFLQNIPLFGRILKGERKGIATALFQVQGSLSDPDVRFMPLKSFATGLTGLSQLAYDILKNTIMLPIDVLKTERTKVSETDFSPTRNSGTTPLQHQ